MTLIARSSPARSLWSISKNPGSELGKTMFRLLDEYARPEDRCLFDFLPGATFRQLAGNPPASITDKLDAAE